VQALVDRHPYRRKNYVAETLAAFNSSMREEADLDSLSDVALGVVRETMQPEQASLWLRCHRLTRRRRCSVDAVSALPNRLPLHGYIFPKIQTKPSCAFEPESAETALRGCTQRWSSDGGLGW
jgi:hypothetical protein